LIAYLGEVVRDLMLVVALTMGCMVTQT